MSTKIYDAYRIKKSTDILSILVKAKEMATNIIANDGEYLYMLHGLVMLEALKTIEKDPENVRAKRALECNEVNDLDIWWVEDVMEIFDKEIQKNPLDIYISCSIFYDRKYWYVKFFPNNNLHSKIVNEIVTEFEFEDYHYQNQCDPPQDIPYKTFEKRDNKWDQLLAPNGDYTNGFQFTIFDYKELTKLLTRNYYRGMKTNEELYSHLAYKFDKNLKQLNP